jgi:hypothetical protein
MNPPIHPDNRYLSLTGIIFELNYIENVVFPSLESLKKKFFGSHPDEPVILHRKELINRKHPFESLRDPDIEREFNEDLLNLLRELDYVVITAVIDKIGHLSKYRVWQSDPYHYCLTVIVERFVLWLKRRNGVGDVMAESRGGNEDKRLKAAFSRIYQGTYIESEDYRKHLTSSQLKVKQKSNNIAGLQIADLLAHPSFVSTLVRRMNEDLPSNFGGLIAQILENNKYDRDDNGKIDGWRRRWLPI